MPTNCSAVIAILDAHFNSHIQQRRADSRRFVSFHGGNGVGDEVNGFLLSLVASLVRGRRLEIAPQSTSYLSAFEPPFDLNYTGPLDALEAVPRVVRSFANETTECGRRPTNATGCDRAFCRAGAARSCGVMPRENRYVPRPFDVASTRSWLQHMPAERVELLSSDEDDEADGAGAAGFSAPPIASLEDLLARAAAEAEAEAEQEEQQSHENHHQQHPAGGSLAALEATLERTKATLVAERDALAKRLGDAERARAAMQVAVNDGKERLKQAQLTSTGAVQLLRASTAEAERKVAVAGGALAERTAELDAAKLQLAQLHAAAMSGGGGGGRSPGLTTPAMAPRPYSATPALMTAPPALAAPPARGLKAQRASLLDTLREERVKLDRERALIRSGGGLYGAPRGS